VNYNNYYYLVFPYWAWPK